MEKSVKKVVCRVLGLLSAGVLLLGLGACNTMEGLGKDIKKAGQSIEGAAK
ncbi:MAG: entericidin A/B family lipoprotein [Burkholderiales bacterium]|nr:entericidin A/B family lipoprotein [Burkholderiales bacterium]